MAFPKTSHVDGEIVNAAWINDIEDRINRAKTPRGPVFYPEDPAYGAKGDLILFTDGAIQAGSSTITSSKFTSGGLSGGANSKRIYVAWAGAGTSAGTTSGTLTVGNAITSIPRTSGAAVPAGPVIVSQGGNAQLFNTAGAAQNASITVTSVTALYTFTSGAAVSFGNTGLSTTIASMANGSATLATTATQTVANMTGWFGTDDTTAFRALFTAMGATGGNVVLDSVGYLIDGTPSTTGNGNAIVPLPLVTLGSINIIGGHGKSIVDTELDFVNAELSATVIATTRLTDTYDASHGVPSMMGGPTVETTGNAYPQISSVVLENFSFLQPENPCMFSLDASLVSRFRRHCVRSKTAGQLMRAAYNFTTNVGSGYGSMGQLPTNKCGGGFWLPAPFNFADTVIERSDTQGHYVGEVMSAHTFLTNYFSMFCQAGIAFASYGNLPSGVHMNKIDKLGIFACNYGFTGYDPTNGITSLPASANPVAIEGDVNFENDANQWATIAPTLDVNGKIRWRGYSHYYNVLGGPGQTPASSAGMCVKEIDPTVYIPTYDDVVLADTPTAYLPLNEPSGTAASDKSGNSHNGTYSGTPLLALNGPLGTDNSVNFKATSSQYCLLDALGTTGANIGSTTWEFWLKTTTTAQQAVFGSSHATAGTNFFVELNTTNGGIATVGTTAILLTDQTGAHHRQGHFTTNIYDGCWHLIHIIPGATGNHVCYVDGVQQTVTMEGSPGTLGTLANFTNAPAIGAWNNTGTLGILLFLDGRIAKFAVYPSQLTATKIVARWATALRAMR